MRDGVCWARTGEWIRRTRPRKRHGRCSRTGWPVSLRCVHDRACAVIAPPIGRQRASDDRQRQPCERSPPQPCDQARAGHRRGEPPLHMVARRAIPYGVTSMLFEVLVHGLAPRLPLVCHGRRPNMQIVAGPLQRFNPGEGRAEAIRGLRWGSHLGASSCEDRSMRSFLENLRACVGAGATFSGRTEPRSCRVKPTTLHAKMKQLHCSTGVGLMS